MPADFNVFTLSVSLESDADDMERDELARRLRKELLSLNAVESVEPASTVQASGSKSIMGTDWHTLLVTLAASGGILTTAIGTLQAWLVRNEKASITLEMDGDKLAITGTSSETQRLLVQEWIVRHQRPST
jgi:hypothetical protein